uniref:NADH-ubiquinone oxidoreductase chain 4L n=1 Tax=Linuparus trigonus TaxID=198218 RepID=A0A7D3UJB1_9EUCA|nr:NADH dehydrogenase subunit 4L [Linuparus trigonus]QKE42655.1 NADH dehydrogenase subunit 4L [Linuparus trigonus]
MVILKLSSVFIPVIMVFCGLWVFTSKCKHLLNTLLSLEFIMLGIFFVMGVSISYLGQEVYFVLFFLSMVACEGALGLSLLVSIVRTHGNDYYNSFSILQC